MKTSRTGLELIKKWEGCRLTAYQDSVGVWTIGYGLTSAANIISVVKGLTITQKQADEYLAQALGKYEAAVEKAITRPMNPNQFDAMTSLCYNIGPGAFAKSSIVSKFNAGDVQGAADAFLLYRKAGGKVISGLEARRADERKLFLLPIGATVTPMPQPVAPVPPAPAPIPPATPESPLPATPVPPSAGASLAGWVLGAAAALIAALAAWIMKG